MAEAEKKSGASAGSNDKISVVPTSAPLIRICWLWAAFVCTAAGVLVVPPPLQATIIRATVQSSAVKNAEERFLLGRMCDFSFF
jgi:hypothetical protein